LPPVENLLSVRELEVLKLVAQGLTNQEIAALIPAFERFKYVDAGLGFTFDDPTYHWQSTIDV